MTHENWTLQENGSDIKSFFLLGGYFTTVDYIQLYVNLRQVDAILKKGYRKQKGLENRRREIRDGDLEFNKRNSGDLEKNQIHVLYLCQDTFLSIPAEEVRGDLAGQTAEEA